MDGLRWLLLFFGLLVIAGVYFYSRRERDRPEIEKIEGPRVAPTIGDEDVELTELEPDSAAVDDAATAVDKLASEAPQKIVTLRLIARDGAAFRGDDLILSLRGIGLRHGKFGIFHRYDGNDEDRTIFSAASLVEPGSFDLANIKEQEIPGISLFLVLPGPVDGVEAFDMMMTAARAIAQTLNAELLDESGSTLSIQRERYMREEIIQYQHSILVA
ncbi:MAG: cell division protein ZipA [Gammaproteobacteria bacterium]|nr:cell division protein ZipA [Gammaproteobacteria bacterium]MDH3373391.1 cell division protein ZipA [Gammaproteobacteria bacterium]MDH3410685.1 cell division protein ZipA [Gammaproteobacteria bacterium]